MKSQLTFVYSALFITLVCTYPLYADTGTNEPVSIPGMVTIKATVQEAPPAWALMERHLIQTMEEAAPVFLNRFTGPGGALYNYGEWDDVFEMFYNWPLFYAIGADEKIFEWAIRQYNAATRQGTVLDSHKSTSEGFFVREPSLYKEFSKAKDWFHISEGMMAFYDLAVGNPAIPENRDRAKRFAGFYMNEDPEAANYDPAYKIIRGAATGSDGPAVNHYDAEYNISYGHASLYPFVKEVEKDWNKNPARRKELLALYNKIVTPCDVPVNLCATGLVTNAYLYTGDEKYKQWVLDYVNAWLDRIKQNNGILPDNIGRTDKIGEYRNGQWWGGLYGWTGRYSIHMIYGALSVAAENALLLTGDFSYLEILRSQIDQLMEQAITTKEGQMLVPYNYGPDGWTSYRPIIIRDLAHLWHASMATEDWKRIVKVMNGNKFYPLPYSMRYASDGWKPEKPFDWNYVPSLRDRSDDNPTEFPRLMYYAGENPDWPLRILMADYQEVIRKAEFIRADTRDIHTIHSDNLLANNPVITKGLQQVTMGAPQTIYNGGLLRARVRYFDIDRARPGLPPDTAALVEGLEADRTVVRLVNLSVMDTRRLIIQAGAFGEHEFTEVSIPVIENDKSGTKIYAKKETIRINKNYFAVELPPGTEIKLDIGTKRFVNTPTYAFPWH